MAEPQTVTLSVGVESLTILADTEMPIHEVAKWTGYNMVALRHLDKIGKIVPSHRLVVVTDGVPRVTDKRAWSAREVPEIVAYRQRTAEKKRKFMSKLYRMSTANRKSLAGGQLHV